MAVSHPHMPATTETPVDRTEPITPPDARGDDTSVGQPESFHVGMSDRLGRYADAIRLPAHTVQVLTSGTPGLTPTGAIPETFEAEAQQAWANVRKALLAAGACLRDVVSVRGSERVAGRHALPLRRQWCVICAHLPQVTGPYRPTSPRMSGRLPGSSTTRW